MDWDPAEYHPFAMVDGIEFVQELDNEGNIKFCIFERLYNRDGVWMINFSFLPVETSLSAKFIARISAENMAASFRRRSSRFSGNFSLL